MLYANINSKDAYIQALRETLIKYLKLCICQYTEPQRDCNDCRHAKKLLDT